MKSKQLLSIVFSLIMFTGITAGNAVFAESDDNDNHKVKLDSFCEMTDEEKRDFASKHEKTEERLALMNEYCSLDEDGKIAFLEEHKDDYKRYHTNYMKDMADKYCEMSDEEKRDFISEHDKVAEHVERMNAYCELDEDARADYIAEHKDDYKMNHENMRAMVDRYCEMSNEEKRDLISKYDKAEEHVAKMNEYCDLDEESKDAFIADFKKSMKDKMSDYKKDHMMNVDEMQVAHKNIVNHKAEYERFCQMTSEELENSIDNPERLAKVTEWCEMTPEEREDFKKTHRDIAMDFKDKHMGALGITKEQIDNSPRLRAMIMEKHGMDRTDEIREKFELKHGDADKIKSEVKMKFKNHMAAMKVNISDERKSAILDRVAEMREFKMEMRDNTSDLTDEEKQELREKFIEKAKEIQLAWISPRTQMTAGVNADEIECREGFSLVMKESNGVPMCLKADTALVMIERGIAVPAN